MDTFAEVYGLTDDWVKEFFKKPDSYIDEYFGIPACGDNPNCADIANRVLRSKRNSWSGSKDKGKILVFLTYIIGSSIMREKGNLKWITKYDNGFLDTISIGDDYKIMRIFDKIANFDTDYFILNNEGFDILAWKRLLRFEEVASNRPVPGARIDIIKE